MKKEILNKIKSLGGDISQVKHISLQADLAAISFKHPLYEIDFGESLYGIDAFFDANKYLYLSSKESFYNALMAYFYSDIKTPYGQMLFRNTLFTPFVKGTADFDESNQ